MKKLITILGIFLIIVATLALVLRFTNVNKLSSSGVVSSDSHSSSDTPSYEDPPIDNPPLDPEDPGNLDIIKGVPFKDSIGQPVQNLDRIYADTTSYDISTIVDYLSTLTYVEATCDLVSISAQVDGEVLVSPLIYVIYGSRDGIYYIILNDFNLNDFVVVWSNVNLSVYDSQFSSFDFVGWNPELISSYLSIGAGGFDLVLNSVDSFFGDIFRLYTPLIDDMYELTSLNDIDSLESGYVLLFNNLLQYEEMYNLLSDDSLDYVEVYTDSESPLYETVLLSGVLVGSDDGYGSYLELPLLLVSADFSEPLDPLYVISCNFPDQPSILWANRSGSLNGISVSGGWQNVEIIDMYGFEMYCITLELGYFVEDDERMSKYFDNLTVQSGDWTDALIMVLIPS